MCWLAIVDTHAMHSQPFRLLLLTALCAAGFSSCIRTDIGTSIGSIGKELPKAVPTHDYGGYSAEVYAKDGYYYASLPIVYVPEPRCGLEYVPQFIGEPITEVFGEAPSGTPTLNKVYSGQELRGFPARQYYVKIAQDKAKQEHYTTTSHRGTNGYFIALHIEDAQLVKAEEFNPAEAQHLGSRNFSQAVNFAATLPAERAWYNYPLIPLQYTAMLVLDVPLSLITMPLSLPYVLSEPMIYNIDTTQPE